MTEHVETNWVDDMVFESSVEGFTVKMDAEEQNGGKHQGPRPKLLLLGALAGCTGMDVISILKKKRQEVTGLEIRVKGKKAEDYPKKFTDITLEFIVKGKDISEEAVKKAIELSMNKYCSVKATLEGAAKIGFSYKIIQE